MFGKGSALSVSVSRKVSSSVMKYFQDLHICPIYKQLPLGVKNMLHMQYSWEILEEKKKDGIIQAYMADDEQPRKMK